MKRSGQQTSAPLRASQGLKSTLLLVFLVTHKADRAWTECLRLQWYETRHALRLSLQQLAKMSACQAVQQPPLLTHYCQQLRRE